MLPKKSSSRNNRQRLIPLTEELIQDMLEHEDTEFQTPPGGHVNETVGDGERNLRSTQATNLTNEVRRADHCNIPGNFTNIAASVEENRIIKTNVKMPSNPSATRSQGSKPIATTTSMMATKIRSISNKGNESSSVKCEGKPNKKQYDLSRLCRDTRIVTSKQNRGEKKKPLTKGKMKSLAKEVKKRLEESRLSGGNLTTPLTKAADRIEKELTRQMKEIEIGLDFCNDLKPYSSCCLPTPTRSVQNLVDKVRTNFSLPRDSLSLFSKDTKPLVKCDCEILLDEEEFSKYFTRKTPKVFDNFESSLNSIDKTISDLDNIVSLIEPKNNDTEELSPKPVESIDENETSCIDETSDSISATIATGTEDLEDSRNRRMELYYNQQLQHINLFALPKSNTSLDMNRHKIVNNALSHTNEYYQTNDFDVCRQYVAADHLRTGHRVSKSLGKKSHHQ